MRQGIVCTPTRRRCVGTAGARRTCDINEKRNRWTNIPAPEQSGRSTAGDMSKRVESPATAAALLLLVQLATHWTPAESQGILSEEEAAYFVPSIKQRQPRDPLVELLREQLPSTRAIAGSGGTFTVNETVRGMAYKGHVSVQKGHLHGLAAVSRSAKSCGRRKLQLLWPRVAATFKFKASVNGVRVLGLATVYLLPATAQLQLDVDGMPAGSYRVDAVKASSFSLSSLKGFTHLVGHMSRRLTYASQAALRSFLAGEGRKVLDVTLRRLYNDATPGVALLC
ncbi:hypothetical protein HPB50_012127 [Hyalomma asiaticum]|uniref:Uncharacterized protein n=1 Tax=Hyalomma asiaticum TaxID=266040 RepID=A0ACB7S265_HYAAI|nr:hypothetical protein HPB50_012127 [Hyalomma asiaticum]